MPIASSPRSSLVSLALAAVALGAMAPAVAQELTVVSFGGAYQEGQSKALFQPAAKAEANFSW